MRLGSSAVGGQRSESVGLAVLLTQVQRLTRELYRKKTVKTGRWPSKHQGDRPQKEPTLRAP